MILYYESHTNNFAIARLSADQKLQLKQHLKNNNNNLALKEY